MMQPGEAVKAEGAFDPLHPADQDDLEEDAEGHQQSGEAAIGEELVRGLPGELVPHRAMPMVPEPEPEDDQKLGA